ncbi:MULTISPECIES: N-succinylarginine dihydrolase [Marinomonas]|uniref:N-succinylarginine dihydrolase n=1 Tax=Marinomonas arctica TaxID=383750 RepID=A0A7H1J556_9GAMM|nr:MULTISPECIES: N-succinylarginine dihydrolase [Marinomonas]MCS7486327.1 N-succinylarginine dihydrolase [Marinomonas sp. BSi20414]QNT05622.1 N-succinylarginine dihydrolase [Marinomonas arctica]GGN29816.1 N-succinylarginine dihydrolase [Marinomonas arctica]
MNTATEANFDGLVGPTHNYSGLSFGNVASLNNSARPSNPKAAAKQGLVKMKALADMGFVQGVLAPHERPHIPTLRRLGFSGSDANILEQAAKHAPKLLAAVSSASCMWTANAATVSPSGDTSDRRVHFTPANLVNKFHRSIEHETTGAILRATFRDEQYFAHHPALPSVDHFGDEGAANHTRFCHGYGEQGIEFFVYGMEAFNNNAAKPAKFPARHTLEASQAVARRHGLSANQVVYAQQNPDVIDAGVFHNDVIAVGNRNAHFYHQEAFLDTTKMKQDLLKAWGDRASQLHLIEVPSHAVSVQDCIQSYLFNSQLLSRGDDDMVLVVPGECENNPAVWAYLNSLVAGQSPINEIKVFDLKQSMSNGGGPACLRLRVALTQTEQAAINPSTIMNNTLFERLNIWVDKHYRDELHEQDLADPQLLIESRTALDELTKILDLGHVYEFQT